MKIISIGDIHGRNTWKVHLFGSIQGYQDWKDEVENGISEFMSDLYPYRQFDKIIFVGDYVDSFDVSNSDMLSNFEELVYLKRAMPERVILLLGNHDIQYIHRRPCTGYRPEMHFTFGKIFKNNEECFQIAYLHQNAETGKHPKNSTTKW
jgi:metallophosphoesterase superfamily enzyme